MGSSPALTTIRLKPSLNPCFPPGPFFGQSRAKTPLRPERGQVVQMFNDVVVHGHDHLLVRLLLLSRR